MVNIYRAINEKQFIILNNVRNFKTAPRHLSSPVLCLSSCYWKTCL